jgi:hypothetical protein
MKKILSIIVILGLIAGAVFFTWNSRSSVSLDPLREITTPRKVVFSEKYVDSLTPIMFQYPAHFKVRTIDVPNELNENVHTILVESAILKEGIQIVVTPYDGAKPITEALIKQEIPDLVVTDAQVLELGDVSQGVAFKSDNQSFGGDSREVWFEYKGMLYQISTYASNDAFLKSFFATWQLQ